MKEIESLVQKAGESIKAAELLISQNFYEFGVGRAYYAMFYLIEALLLTKNYSSKTHSGVIGLFNKEFVKTGIFSKEYGRFVGEAFDLRAKGDYETGTDIWINEFSANEVLSNSKAFKEITVNYLTENNFI